MHTHESTKVFLLLFQDWNYINILEYLNGLDEFTGEYIERRELMVQSRISSSTYCIVLKFLLKMDLIEKRKIGNKIFIKANKERYVELSSKYKELENILAA